MGVVMERRTYEFETYLYNLAFTMDCSALQYWKKYGHVDLVKLELVPEQSLHRLYVFPGRAQVRPGIEFDKMDKQQCSKNYFKVTSAVPSFLTVQCVCAHPKLLGFVLLKDL